MALRKFSLWIETGKILTMVGTVLVPGESGQRKEPHYLRPAGKILVWEVEA